MSTLVIGLGNPGGEYARTRHNAGWLCLDELEERGRFGRSRREGPCRLRHGSIEGYEIVTARPQTYMNNSGRAGAHLTRTLGIPPEDVIVVHDDVDLPLGRLRLKRGGSAAGQRGVQSLASAWRTQEFVRVRIGIGRPGGRNDVTDYVLDTFEPAERVRLPLIMARAADAVLAIVSHGLDAAMNDYNRSSPEPADA